ncbi:MAG: Trk system potassium transporter TrkA [Planctomycetota bacterium JB042]
MKIVIAGAGAVGFNLARELSEDKHDIVVIDPEPELIGALRNRVDVQAVAGSCTDVDVLEQASVAQADMFIAVTNADEVNIVSCMLAHALGAKRRLARVRNPRLSAADAVVEKRSFHINRIVNPDVLAVETALRLIKSPGVTFGAEFAEGEVLLRAFRVPEEVGIHDQSLAELATKFPDRPFLVAALERGGEVRIPRGQDELKIGDIVYLLMLKDREHDFRALIGEDARSIGRVVVYGASKIGLEVLRRLDGVADKVLLEDSREGAEQAAESIEGVLVLHGWVSDAEVGREVDYGTVDCFVAASDDDRMNLVAALYAKQRGVKRTIVLTREPGLVPLIRALGFDGVVNARLLAVSEIARFVRPGKVLAVQKIGSGGAEAAELLVRKGSKATDKSLRDLRLPEGAIVGSVFRDGAAFLPTGDTVLEPGDDIVAFVLDDVRDQVERLFAGSRKIKFEAGT